MTLTKWILIIGVLVLTVICVYSFGFVIIPVILQIFALLFILFVPLDKTQKVIPCVLLFVSICSGIIMLYQEIREKPKLELTVVSFKEESLPTDTSIQFGDLTLKLITFSDVYKLYFIDRIKNAQNGTKLPIINPAQGGFVILVHGIHFLLKKVERSNIQFT